MNKKRILSVVLIVLSMLLLLVGCTDKDADGSASEQLLIAKEKTTEFKVVNYLEKNSWRIF